MTSVIVVPRERFAPAGASLEAVVRTVPPGTPVVCVDAGSPKPVADALAALAEEHDVLLLRTRRPMPPNGARNLGLEAAPAGPVAFVDLDTHPSPGWVEALDACAADTGAWLISPLILEQAATRVRIHIAGGECRIDDVDGRRLHVATHRFEKLDPADVPLVREQTNNVEFHAVYLSAEARELCAPLDTEFRSARDHDDVVLQVAAAGGTMWFEPASVVTYLLDTEFPAFDRRYWLLRWSEQSNQRSLARFAEKWDLAPDDPGIEKGLRWTRRHRYQALRRRPFSKARFPRVSRRLLSVFDRVMAPTGTPWCISWARPDDPVAVVHRPGWAAEALATRQ